MVKFTTRTRLGNEAYPIVLVNWEQENNSYIGEVSIWTSDSQISCEGHTIRLNQSTPLGHISVSVDDCGYGCWATTYFEGVSITERDLQWAAAYASEAIKNKHKTSQLPCKR